MYLEAGKVRPLPNSMNSPMSSCIMIPLLIMRERKMKNPTKCLKDTAIQLEYRHRIKTLGDLFV